MKLFSRFENGFTKNTMELHSHAMNFSRYLSRIRRENHSVNISYSRKITLREVRSWFLLSNRKLSRIYSRKSERSIRPWHLTVRFLHIQLRCLFITKLYSTITNFIVTKSILNDPNVDVNT